MMFAQIDKIIKLIFVLLFFTFFLFASCKNMVAERSQLAPSFPVKEYEQKWGISLEGIRYTAGGYMLDFRFKVLEPSKAALLLNPKDKPYLLDEKSRRRVFVPAPAKVGALRQTNKSGKPLAGRVYFIIFANPGKLIKQGDAVTIVIGDFKADGLKVQ